MDLRLEQFIGFDEVMAIANEDLLIDNIVQYKDTLAQWAFEAIRDIQSIKSRIAKTCDIEIKEFRGKLPNDFYEFEDAGNGCSMAEETRYLGDDCPNDYLLRVDLRGNCIYTSFQTGSIKINYWALPADSEGYPQIKLSQDKAVAFYLVFRWLRARFLAGKVPEYVYKTAKQEWEDECARARGHDNMPSKAKVRTVWRVRRMIV